MSTHADERMAATRSQHICSQNQPTHCCPNQVPRLQREADSVSVAGQSGSVGSGAKPRPLAGEGPGCLDCMQANAAVACVHCGWLQHVQPLHTLHEQVHATQCMWLALRPSQGPAAGGCISTSYRTCQDFTVATSQ